MLNIVIKNAPKLFDLFFYMKQLMFLVLMTYNFEICL